MFGKTVFFGSLALSYIFAGCARQQVLDHQAISQASFWRLRNEVVLLPSRNQRSGWLTNWCKNNRFLKLSVPQLWCKPIACVASIWVYHVATVRVRGMKNQSKYANTHAPFCVVSNRDHCFSLENLMSPADIHEIVTDCVCL